MSTYCKKYFCVLTERHGRTKLTIILFIAMIDALFIRNTLRIPRDIGQFIMRLYYECLFTV
jgi:hypothetical protein